ncbi:MAG: DNA primase [Longimonas sp.]|uniref:DNA primase n=1 Tax=Longimonas sp. TaxID=2039626 RepID=UPI0033622ACE
MPIPNETLDEIRAAVDAVHIMGQHTDLKQSGTRWKGLCPFHDERTPSFTVDAEQGLYHCFGCRAGGDVIDFVQQAEGLDFLEAVRFLADEAGIALPDEHGASADARKRRESLKAAVRVAARYFYNVRCKADAGAPARTYLQGRHFDEDALKRFGIGYAPDGWERLLTHAQEQHISVDVLEDAGLVIERPNGRGYYDRFRGRVIFPIFSHRGEVLAFAGRHVDEGAGDPDTPKYVNSPATPLYDKSSILYGFYQARTALTDTREAWVVEGYTDVLALHGAGIRHAVATCGTALTDEHLKALMQRVDHVMLLFDGDEAGDSGSDRAMQRCIRHGIDASACTLPDGHDPCSYLQEHGADELRAYAQEHRLVLHDVAARKVGTGWGDAIPEGIQSARIDRAADALADELRTHFGADAPAVASALASKMNATTDHAFIEQAQ